MQTARKIYSSRFMMLLLLLTVLVAGCGGDDSDESVPALTFDGTDPNTTARSRQLAGDVEPGAVVQVTVDTTAVVNALQVAAGRWSCTIEALVPGSNLVTILATDSSGNQNAVNLALLYDALSIERWVTPIPGNTLTIGGLIDPVAAGSLALTVDTGAATFTAVTGDHWEAELSGLLPGNNVVTAQINHPDAGVALVEQKLTISVDAAAPVITIDPVISPTDVDSQPVRGTRTDNLVLTILAPTADVENLNLTDAPAAWSATLNKLQQGKNPFTVSATASGVTVTARDLIVHDAPPSIVETLPAAEAVDVSPASPVRATFSEPMQEATINSTTFSVACQGIPVGGTVNFAGATRTATFTPDVPLPAGACIATLTAAITDQAGNALTGFSWSFTVN